MAHKLFIGGLSFSTTEERLRELFAGAGTVEIGCGGDGPRHWALPGFGFVEMATAEDAAEAVKKFNGQNVDGRTLKVELANPSGSGGGRGGGGGRRSGGGGGGEGAGRRGSRAGGGVFDPGGSGVAVADRQLRR